MLSPEQVYFKIKACVKDESDEKVLQLMLLQLAEHLFSCVITVVRG